MTALFSPTTAEGHDLFEVLSAMQKCIRRGDEEGAGWWAFAAAASGYLPHVIGRLEVVAVEDVGVADPVRVTAALTVCQQARTWGRAGRASWKLAIAAAVQYLCRAEKSRASDEMQAAILGARARGEQREIPDVAIDKHTRRGRAKGRGVDHFMAEGTRLDPPAAPAPDVYRERAAATWKQIETDQAFADRYSRMSAAGKIGKGAETEE